MKTLANIFGVLAFFSLAAAILKVLFLFEAPALMPPGARERWPFALAQGIVFAMLSKFFLRRSRRPAR